MVAHTAIVKPHATLHAGCGKAGEVKVCSTSWTVWILREGQSIHFSKKVTFSSVLVTVAEGVGVRNDGVVVHLAMPGTGCWVVELLPVLVAAVAMSAGHFEGWELVTTVWVFVDTVELVTALLAMLDTAELVSEELVEVLAEEALELVAALRAWKAAALLLSFSLFLSLFLFLGGCEGS